jgi:hypothetical protein
MVHVVEVPLYVDIDKPFRSLPDPLNGPQGCMAGSLRAKSMRAVLEDRLVDSFQKHSDHLLHLLIVGGREAQRAHFPSTLLWYVDSSHWVRLVSSFSDEFDEVGRPFW